MSNNTKIYDYCETLVHTEDDKKLFDNLSKGLLKKNITEQAMEYITSNNTDNILSNVNKLYKEYLSKETINNEDVIKYVNKYINDNSLLSVSNRDKNTLCELYKELYPRLGNFEYFSNIIINEHINFERMKMLLDTLKKYANLLSSKNVILSDYPTYEELDDHLNLLIIENENLKFSLKFISNKYKFLLSDNAIRLFGILKTYVKKHSVIQEILTSKLAAYDKAEDLEYNIERLIDAYNTDYSIDAYQVKALESGAQIAHVDNRYLVIKLGSYNQCKTLAPTSWCIQRDASQFNTYVSNRRIQYIVYDFSVSFSHKMSVVGITVSMNGSVYSNADKYNNYIYDLKQLYPKEVLTSLLPYSKEDVLLFIKNGIRINKDTLNHFKITKEMVMDIVPDYFVSFKEKLKNAYFSDNDDELIELYKKNPSRRREILDKLIDDENYDTFKNVIYHNFVIDMNYLLILLHIDKDFEKNILKVDFRNKKRLDILNSIGSHLCLPTKFFEKMDIFKLKPLFNNYTYSKNEYTRSNVDLFDKNTCINLYKLGVNMVFERPEQFVTTLLQINHNFGFDECVKFVFNMNRDLTNSNFHTNNVTEEFKILFINVLHKLVLKNRRILSNVKILAERIINANINFYQNKRLISECYDIIGDKIEINNDSIECININTSFVKSYIKGSLKFNVYKTVTNEMIDNLESKYKYFLSNNNVTVPDIISLYKFLTNNKGDIFKSQPNLYNRFIEMYTKLISEELKNRKVTISQLTGLCTNDVKKKLLDNELFKEEERLKAERAKKKANKVQSNRASKLNKYTQVSRFDVNNMIRYAYDYDMEFEHFIDDDGDIILKINNKLYISV